MKKNTETTITETTIGHENQIEILELDDLSLDDVVGAGGGGGVQNGVGFIALCLNGNIIGNCHNEG